MHNSMRDWNLFTKRAGLSMPQFGILTQLQHKGSCGMSAISDHFGITPAAASQLVDKLVQAGYLERTEDSNDRRVRLLNLSTKGGKLLHQATEERYRWMDDLTSKLSPEEQDKIVTALNILIKAARVMEEQK